MVDWLKVAGGRMGVWEWSEAHTPTRADYGKLDRRLDRPPA